MSAQPRIYICLYLAVGRSSPLSQCAADKVKTQMECQRDLLERDDDSPTMAALFPPCCFFGFFVYFFFCLDPKPLLPGSLEAEEKEKR